MRIFIWLCLAVLYVFGVVYFINDDLWNDEIYTLQHFVLVALRTTVTDYHVPNNHVLYSLICTIYLKIIGVQSLAVLMAKPFILRSIGLIFSVLNIYYLYKCAKKIGDKDTVFWTFLAFVTTLPLYSFQFQVRGYGLLMCLNSVFLHCFLCFQARQNWQNATKTILVGALTLYAVPSNLLVLFGFGVYSLIGVSFDFYKKRKFDFEANKTAIFSVICLILAVLCSFLWYAPILKSVLNNDYINEKMPYSEVYRIFKTCLIDFVGLRLVLFALSGLGIYFIIKNKTKEQTNTLILLILVVFMPFLISFIKHSATPSRVYTEIIPFSALLIGFTVDFYIKKLETIEKIQKYFNFIKIITVFTSILGICLSFNIAKRAITYDLQNAARTQELNVNYYQHAYQPYAEIMHIKTLFRQKQNNLPIVILDNEPHDIPHFLTTFDLSFCESNKLDSLAANTPTFIALVRYLPRFEARMQHNYPNVKLNFLNPSEKIYYPRAIVCTRKDGEK
jgi:hypothetical protein